MSVGKFNIQTKREMIRFLTDNGYFLKRNGKHMIFSNGLRHISVPTGKGTSINPMVASRLVKEVLQNKAG